MAFDIQTLASAATCAECLNQEQKQNVALYLLSQIVETGGSGGGADCLHNLLSAIHPDTLPAAVSRGSLIVGNATPLWAELTIGAAGTVLTSDGADASWAAPVLPGGFTGFANPTALVGLVAVNGAATTAMRSDAAPALDVAIVPTWTGTHTFTASATIIGSAANALNVIQIVPPAALGANMVDLFSDGGPGYNSIRKYFSSPFQVEIASSGGIDFVIDSNNNETGQSVKFLTNALRGGVQTTLFTFLDSGVLVFSPVVAGAIQFNPFGVAAGNTSEMRYLELLANGTNYTGFKAPDSLATSEIYVFPDAAPAANRFLRAGAVAAGVSTLTWAQASLTADVTGTLPVGNGGTGLTTGTSGGILGFTAAATLASSVLLTANALILGGGAGATPVPMASLGTTTTVLHGNAAGAPTFGAVVLTTDVSGILPVANGGSGTSTAFTAGSVIFAGAAGVYAQDNANLFYDDSANRLIVNQLGLPNTTSATVGGIYLGGSLAISNFGTNNFFIGKSIGNFTMSGTNNSAIGNNILTLNTTGGGNNVMGISALSKNTTGMRNVAIGSSTLSDNTTGSDNVALGNNALTASTIGTSNVAIGASALLVNVDGISNMAIGTSALRSNISGGLNTAVGVQALRDNTGSNNVAVGTNALLLNSSGANNIAIGVIAGDNLTTGSNNIIIGYNIDTPAAANSNTLTIGNLIFGTAIDGTGVALSSGNIGIGVITPLAKLHVINSAAATVAEIIKAAAAQSANLTEWQDSSAVILTKVNSVGNVGVRMAATALTAYLHIAAGNTAASTAPIKLTTGTSMTAAEAGAVEFTTDDLFFTITTGAARKRLLMADPVGGLTSGRVPFATTNGRLTDDATLLFGSSTLTVPNITVGAAGVLQVGNAAAIGAALVSTHSVTIKDSTGTTYRVPILV